MYYYLFIKFIFLLLMCFPPVYGIMVLVVTGLSAPGIRYPCYASLAGLYNILGKNCIMSGGYHFAVNDKIKP